MTKAAPIKDVWTECPDCWGAGGYYDDLYDGGVPTDYIRCVMCQGTGEILDGPTLRVYPPPRDLDACPTCGKDMYE